MRYVPDSNLARTEKDLLRRGLFAGITRACHPENRCSTERLDLVLRAYIYPDNRQRAG